MILVAGLAVTEAVFVAGNPVDGDQLYVVAPEAVRVVEPPAQMDASDTEILGIAFTVTVNVELVLAQPEAELLTVNVPV